jgi:hypothetical protein
MMHMAARQPNTTLVRINLDHPEIELRAVPPTRGVSVRMDALSAARLLRDVLVESRSGAGAAAAV